MDILITGGAGFIGSSLCIKLQKNNNVFVIDSLSSQIHGYNPYIESPSFLRIKDKVNFIKGDVSNIETWENLPLKKFDVIIHLASETGTGQSMFNSYNYCHTNICSLALINDLILQKKIECKKIILSSSRSVYGTSVLSSDDIPIPSKEVDICDPKSIYAITKLTQEYILINGFQNIEVCILRLQNVYGPYQSLNNPYTGIISIFSNSIKNNKNLYIFDDGKMSRDFIYIDDVIDGILITINNGRDREIYNIGSGVSTTVYEVAEHLKRLFNSDINIVITGEKLKGDIRHNIANIDKIKKIGFIPKISFEDGIYKYVNWVKEQNLYFDNIYEDSLKDFREKGLLN